MAVKTLVAYGKVLALPRATAATNVEIEGKIDPSAIALLPSNMSPPTEDIRFRRLQVDLLGSDDYQVALVPPKRPARQFGVEKSHTSDALILVLPLTWKELIARVRAEADHSESLQQSVVHFGAVCVDLYRMEVSRSGTPVFLTSVEFRVLRFFVLSSGRVISRDELLDKVWGYNNYPSTRTVDNHVFRLRQKLETDPAHPTHFKTVHGIGYKFVVEANRIVAEGKL